MSLQQNRGFQRNWVHSFRSHENLTIPVLPVADFAAKRRKLLRIVSSPLPQTTCVQFHWFGSKCPKSFGNVAHMALSPMLLARVLDAGLVQTRSTRAGDTLDCGGLLTPKLLQAGLRTTFRENTSVVAAHTVLALKPHVRAKQYEESVAQLSNATLPTNSCVAVAGSQQQEMAPLRETRNPGTEALFGLGVHAALGALWDAAYAFNDSNPAACGDTSCTDASPEDELRISVHLRHKNYKHVGNESIAAIERAIGGVALGARRCAILLASDRRLSLHSFEAVAARLGCRLVTSPRGSREGKRTYSIEHGIDTDVTVLRDVYLLASGHLLVGAWGSSLTLLIQELIAARYRGAPAAVPTVIYCDPLARGCLPPWPLVTTAENAWYVTMIGYPAGHIGIRRGSFLASELK